MSAAPPAPAPTTTAAPANGAVQLEWDMATDMVRRGLPLAPVVLGVGALGWGVHGVLSSGYGLVLVLCNLLVCAASMKWAAARSLAVLTGVSVVGFAVRMAVVTLAVWAVKGTGWVELLPLGLTIVVTQLGLLWWETRQISLSLAYPGLKPSSGRS
ncbi:MAG TPA: ATP synthase subunit I [Acidimicrobiales bacterium]|nr:ATP synthase subunit I [Acidimicrobiales bacterium]